MDEPEFPANDYGWSEEQKDAALARQIAEMEADPAYQEQKRMTSLHRKLQRHEELRMLILNPKIEFNTNRLAFTMVMHAAVHLCGISPRLIARHNGLISVSQIMRYVTGEAAAGVMVMAGSSGRDRFMYITMLTLIERRIKSIRPRYERMRTAYEILHGLALDPDADDENVFLLNPRRSK